jgi:S1-C subfamily serine protease
MFHTGLHDDYHRPSDDADKVNAEGMRLVSRLVTNVVLQLADRLDSADFRHAARGEDRLAQEQFERALPPPRPRLGIRCQRPADEGLGVVVTHVMAGSAADEAGLQVGDRLLRIAGQDILGTDELVDRVLRAVRPAVVVVQRPGAGEPFELQVPLPGRPIQLGVSWREDRAEPASVYLTRVVDGSPAHHAGLQAGDRIYEVSGRAFAGGDEFRQLVTTLPWPLELTVERGGRLRWSTVDWDIKAMTARARGASPEI